MSINREKDQKNCVNLPPLLYKYKRVDTKEDLERIIDILDNHRIYLPSIYDLNDPFETAHNRIVLDGVLGQDISAIAGRDHAVVEQEKRKFGVYALTTRYDSCPMWAYYTDNFKGVCLCFTTKDTFSNVKQISYNSYNQQETLCHDIADIHSAVLKSLEYKNPIWEHEDEYRFIYEFSNEKSQNSRYYELTSDDLVCLIIGHNISKPFKECIEFHSENIKVVKTYYNVIANKLQIIEKDSEINKDGKPINEIPDLKAYILA